MRWWRVFKGNKAKSQPEGDEESLGPRRRSAERYPFEAKLSASCSSWSKVVSLITSDVSAGGLYVPTEANANIGDRIELMLTLPDGTDFPFPGTVVNIVTPELAAQYNKRPGLGVRIDELTGEAEKRFEALLRAAREAQPAPVARAKFSQTGSLTAIHEDSSEDLEARARAKLAEQTPAPPKPAPAPPPPTPPTAPAPKRPSVVIGIDLGTSYTSVATVMGKKIRVLTWEDGNRSSASVVSFPSQHETLVGGAARARLGADPKCTIASPKRLLGRSFDDPQIQGLLAQAAYETVRGPNNEVLIRVWDNDYAIGQLCSYLLRNAVDTAERHLGARVEGAVLTVPVSFDKPRLDALERAARMINLDVMSFIDEPSSAALANRFDSNFGGIVGVFDFGGGTFDFSLVDVSGGDFQVLATAGDSWLGGDDFDLAIADAAANQFWRLNGVDVRNDAVAWHRLLFACEAAKRQLSTAKTAPIYVPQIASSKGKHLDLHITLDRPTFEKACHGVIQRSLATCREALDLVGMKPHEMTSVYLSGGTSYIPAVRRALEHRFDVPVRTGVPPEHSVCLGAAIHAAQLALQGRATLNRHG